MLAMLSVARPLTAVPVVVPISMPPPGLLAMAMLTMFVAVVMVLVAMRHGLLSWSKRLTVGTPLGVPGIGEPALALPGWVVHCIILGTFATMSNAALVALISVPDVATSV